MSVDLVGGPAPYREALSAGLIIAGYEITTIRSDCDALVIYCASQNNWEAAASSALRRPTLVVLSEPALDLFIHALSIRAGAVYIDNPTTEIVAVLNAVIAGEVLLPLAIAQLMASSSADRHVTEISMEETEITIIEGLLASRTIMNIATDLNYSDRTIRRKLKRIYSKLGVSTRAEAIDVLRPRLDNCMSDEIQAISNADSIPLGVRRQVRWR